VLGGLEKESHNGTIDQKGALAFFMKELERTDVFFSFFGHSTLHLHVGTSAKHWQTSSGTKIGAVEIVCKNTGNSNGGIVPQRFQIPR
jgi:hypothetical protein